MSLKDSCICGWEALPVSLASGSSSTDVINLGGLRLFSILMPPAWTAANLTFQSSHDGGATWHDVYKTGSEYVLTTTAGKDLDVDIQRFASIPLLKIRSGTCSTPVTQADARTLVLVLRGI